MGLGSSPRMSNYSYCISFVLWDEAVVACQSHELNVEGSNPSPTSIFILLNIDISIFNL